MSNIMIAFRNLIFDKIFIGAERVGHAEDLWYMWGDENSPNISDVSIADRGMLQRFVQLWINFAKHQ